MKPKEMFLYAFAALFVVGFFVLSWLFRNIENQTVAGVIDTLKMGVVLVLGYFFGSSKGSADKNELLKNQ